MLYRRFGRLGWQVSEIGYGMWGMGGWSGSDEDESRAALRRAVELGCNFFDTAWAYGDGKSERLLGDLVRSFTDRRLYVASKIPPRNRRWPSRREFKLDDCYPPAYIEEYVKKSLENLALPAIDLIQFHTWEDSWMEDDRWVEVIERLKREGVVRGVGISINRWEPWNGVDAVRSGAIDAVQVIYNIFDQNPEDMLFPACAARDVAVIARVPFDEGSLTGNLRLDSRWPEDDWRNTYFVKENLESSVAHAEALRPLVPANWSMTDLALRFILDNRDVSTVIPGMRKLKHVESNIRVSSLGALPEGLRASLRKHRWDREPTEWSQ